MAVGALGAFGDEVESYPLPMYTPYVAALIGATVGCLAGRSRTRIDNFMIGGLFTGFAAFRDPRASVAQTLMVAVVEGLIWGVTDRIVPEIKDKLLPAEAGGGADVSRDVVAGFAEALVRI